MELNKINLLPWILVVFFCAALTAYGAHTGNGAALASSLSVGTILLFLIPVLHIRNRKIQRVQNKTDLLLCWEYAPFEAEDIAREQYLTARKNSLFVAMLLSVCMAIVFIPLVWHSVRPQSGLPPMLPYMIAAILLPCLGVPLVPAIVANRIRRSPCITFIGRDYVLIANRYIGLNDRYKLNLERAEIDVVDGKRMRLHVQYSFKGGRTLRTFYKWVDIPVPYGKEQEATEFINRFVDKQE